MASLLDHKLGISIALAAQSFGEGLEDVLGSFVLQLFSPEECQQLLGGEQGLTDEQLEDVSVAWLVEFLSADPTSLTH